MAVPRAAVPVRDGDRTRTACRRSPQHGPRRPSVVVAVAAPAHVDPLVRVGVALARSPGPAPPPLGPAATPGGPARS